MTVTTRTLVLLMVVAIIAALSTACASEPEVEPVPESTEFTTAPMLYETMWLVDATPEEVWAFVGKPENIVGMSGGMVHSTTMDDSAAEEDGLTNCVRTCHITMPGEDGEMMNVDMDERIVWHSDANMGYAYSIQPDGDNIFGVSNHVAYIIVKPAAEGSGSEVHWISYCNVPDEAAAAETYAGLDQVLGAGLTAHFAPEEDGEMEGTEGAEDAEMAEGGEDAEMAEGDGEMAE